MKKTGQKFMQETKVQNLSESDQRKGLKQPPLEKAFDGVTHRLTPYEQLDKASITLDEAIIKRQTHRKYKDKPLSLDELSYLIYHMQGLKETLPQATKRTVPSAGARHAFDLYVLVNNVESLSSGLYQYVPSKHALGEVNLDASITDKIQAACFNQVMISNSAVTFLLVADLYRMSYRYVERGYRYLHLDAGHVIQNLYLSVEQINAGTCAIAAFNDDLLNQAIGVDGENNFSIYLATVGKI